MGFSINKPGLGLGDIAARVLGLEQRVRPPLEQFPFTSLLPNGGFDADSDWNKGSGWAISGGVASSDGTQVDYSSIDQSIPLNRGAFYQIRASLTFNATGSILLRLGTGTSAGNILSWTASGDHTVTTYPMGGNLDTFSFLAHSNFEGSIDNVSLWEADPADDRPWLRLPYGYSVEDCGGWIVRDGLTLHPPEWEERRDGKQRFIKPLVAPGHDTEFLAFAGVLT